MAHRFFNNTFLDAETSEEVSHGRISFRDFDTRFGSTNRPSSPNDVFVSRLQPESLP